MEQPSIVTFMPCSHRCTCTACSDQVKHAKMDCPLCRQAIVSTTDNHAILPSQNELDDFGARRDDYIKQLQRSCAKNAGYTGKGKQARAVGRAMGSELEERIKENAGTDRYGGMNAEFTTNGNGTFTVKYKVQGKRKPIVETYMYQEWEDAKESLVSILEDDRVDIIGIATHYPEYFWLAKYHSEMDSLKEVTNEKRR